MGVIGWPPQTVLREATLRDLCEAYTAYRAHSHNVTMVPDRPDADFMRAMLARFPDTKKEKAR